MTQQNCRGDPSYVRVQHVPTFGCNGVGLSARSRARRLLRESKIGTPTRSHGDSSCHAVGLRSGDARLSRIGRQPSSLVVHGFQAKWRSSGGSLDLFMFWMHAWRQTYKQARNIETDIHACTDTRRYRHKHTEGDIFTFIQSMQRQKCIRIST